jgi:predicted transcriptional regulator
MQCNMVLASMREVEDPVSDQLTVRLPNDLNAALEQAATRMRRKRSEVVRMALESFLGVGESEPASSRVRDLLGSLETGVPDLAEEHRRHVLEKLQRGG